MHPARRLVLLLVAIAGGLVSSLAGCGNSGPTRLPLAGDVSFDGKPVEDGMILFTPTGDTRGPAAAGPIQGGKYALTAENGPVVGTHRVEIRGLRYPAKPLAVSPPAGDMVAPPEQYLPAKYNESTTLEATIDTTTKTLDFRLTK